MMIMRAYEVAEAAHQGQVDKAGLPYINHPARVSSLVVLRSGSEDAVVTAWLHDVVEDSDVTLDDLRKHGFPETVVEAVDAITRREGEQPEDYYARVKANPIALEVKMADLADNADPERLALLDEETRVRLARKYMKATQILTS